MMHTPSQVSAMSVILEVEHVTTYRYAKPVEFGLHRVAFHPRAAHDIRVLSADLTVSPHSRQHWIHDVFSNSIAVVEPVVPADTLTFTARFVIEHLGVENQEIPVDKEAENYPFEYSAQDRVDVSGFLMLQYPQDAGVVSDWVSSFLPQRGTIHTRDVLSNINEFIRTDFSYASRNTMGTQPPAETLALRSGTCRDFALLMMEAARGLGIAARFVSGYIYDPVLDIENPDPEETVGQGIQSLDAGGGTLGSGATHAWLHVYLPGAGWIPFDPTNTLYGGTDLIRTAFTRTPEQAAPVSGDWTGDAGDFLGLEVTVNVSRRPPGAALLC
jgi:transglutaminase-like putative cysteine protease